MENFNNNGQEILAKKGFVRISDKIVHIPKIKSIGIIGDPGCDGLGTYNMKVYCGALESCANTDLIFVVGDLVPTGVDFFYNMIGEITDAVSEKPVFVLRGNHDTGNYDKFFGRSEYALIFGDVAIVVLDNAERKFCDEGLELLSEIVAMPDVKRVIITFHIPIPNNFTGNSVSAEEFARLQNAYNAHKEKVCCFLCGHVHSRFCDTVDGIPLLCTGGGGAAIEDVSESIKASDVNHHIVRVEASAGTEASASESHSASADASAGAEVVCYGGMKFAFEDLPRGFFMRESKDKLLRERLEESVKNEMMAHLQYEIFAERAKRRGLPKVANLFEALASSEYHHARNFFALLNDAFLFGSSLDSFVATEKFEYDYIYKMAETYAKEHGELLAKQAYHAAATAEKTHAQLIENAEQLEDFSGTKYYVCPTCGNLIVGEAANDRCAVCGCPSRDFEVYGE